MRISIRKYRDSDRAFLKEMLYEAVFWRQGPTTPSYEDALALPEIQEQIAAIGTRRGDTVFVAIVDSTTPVGAAWFRFWTEENDVRGFIAGDVPVVAVAVSKEYRRRGIGGALVDRLAESAREQNISKISLCVSKDNPALKLYRKLNFVEHSDLGHSLNMTRTTEKLAPEKMVNKNGEKEPF